MLTTDVETKMTSHNLTNGQREENSPYEVSPLSSDGDSASLHESEVSGQFDLSLPPAQQYRLQQDRLQQNHHVRQQNYRHNQQNQVQRFSSFWPPPPVGLDDFSNPRLPVPVPPNNTPMVTPENSLEDVSLNERSQDDSEHQVDEQSRHIILHEEPRGRLRARNPQLADLTLAPPVVLRPSSFEIMGCFTPVHLEHSAGPSNGYAGRHGTSRHHGTQYGLNRSLTPYPARAPPAAMMSTGIRRVRVMQDPEAAAGGRAVGANRRGTLRDWSHSRQLSPERYSTKRLVALIAAAGFTLASFLFLVQAVAVITVFRASGKPVSHGYIAECVLSAVFFCPSITGLVFVLAGGSIDFPYTLRSPFARRPPPQPKELELGSIRRPESAMNQGAERNGEVQHQVGIQQAVPGPVRGPAESRERLLRAAASGATVAPSTTQTSIVTELCNAVSAADSQP